MYNIFLVIHIVCFSMVLALLPFNLFMKGRIKRSKGTPVELYNIQLEFSVGKFMGMVGGIGLLIGGAAMAGIGKMPWFAFDNPTFLWLAIKQTLYIIILALNFSVMIPTGKKIMPLIATQMSMGGGVGATDEIRALASKASMVGMIMGLLGLTNAILGAVGPSWHITF
jgi:hypothetical protein